MTHKPTERWLIPLQHPCNHWYIHDIVVVHAIRTKHTISRPFAPFGELARKSTLGHSKCSGWWSGHVITRFQCFRTYSMCLSGLWLAISMKLILTASPHNLLEMMMIPFLPILGDVDLFSELWLRMI